MNIPLVEKAKNVLEQDVVPKDSTNFSFEFEPPLVKASLKASAEDFQVSENLKFELSGEGQHLCLFIEKQFLNTQDALNILSRFFKVPPRAIGYFGLKDKVAVTRQWFSVDLAASALFPKGKASAELDDNHCKSFQEVFPQLLAQSLRTQGGDDAPVKKYPAKMEILEFKRNSKKFKIGQLAGNGFEIVLRNISELGVDSGNNAYNKGSLSKELKATLELKLEQIKAKGFPNYFGEQRFGRDNQNIELLKRNIESDLGKRRALRARIISTLRALVFNRYLSERIDAKNARQYMEGDVLQFSDGNSLFSNRDQDSPEQIQQRLNEGTIVISGPLLGVDTSLASGESLVFEETVLRKFRAYLPVIERFQVKSARRALFVQANNLTWHFSGSDLFLNFELTSGSYATSLVRELVSFRNNKVVG